jgi:hypothetical protein
LDFEGNNVYAIRKGNFEAEHRNSSKVFERCWNDLKKSIFPCGTDVSLAPQTCSQARPLSPLATANAVRNQYSQRILQGNS